MNHFYRYPTIFRMNKHLRISLYASKWTLYLIVSSIIIDGVQLAAMNQTRDHVSLLYMGLVAIVSLISANRLFSPSLIPKIYALLTFIYLTAKLILTFSSDGFNVIRIFIFFLLSYCMCSLISHILKKVSRV